MTRSSAGILLHRRGGGDEVEVLLVHPGGPFWARRDEGAWSIPKGETEEGEDPWAVAEREWAEELGVALPPAAASSASDLGEVRYGSGKRVRAWAVAGELDVERVRSNTFELEWPPRSGRRREFPEIDRAEWFGLEEARRRILPAQAPLLDRLTGKPGLDTGGGMAERPSG